MLKSSFKFARLLLPVLLLPLLSVAAPEQPQIKVMLLTGQSGKAHNWKLCSQILGRILAEPGCFAVDTVTSPPKRGDMSGFHPSFTNYAVVVVDYEGDEWPGETKQAFVGYIRNGGSIVTVHATDNAFPNWPKWNEMIGIGGFGGRTEAAGSKVR